MTITQTVDIPASHRVTIDVPHEIPAGPVTLTFTTASAPRTADRNRKPISRFFGIISSNTYGDGVAYQRAIRDEWND
jgi:hypothetical protein